MSNRRKKKNRIGDMIRGAGLAATAGAAGYMAARAGMKTPEAPSPEAPTPEAPTPEADPQAQAAEDAARKAKNAVERSPNASDELRKAASSDEGQ